MTLYFPIWSKEQVGGLCYTQFYSEMQASFNAVKAYLFEYKGYEHLVINPALAEAIGYPGKAKVPDVRLANAAA